MDMGFIVDTEPVIIKGFCGPHVRFSNGEIHYLTLWERICVKFLGKTAEQLQATLRPRLTHDINVYKQSQAYEKSKNLQRLTQTPVVTVEGIEKVDGIIMAGTEINVKLAPLTCQEPIIRTVDTEMEYFVWRKTMFGPQPQLWGEDYSISCSSNKPIKGIIKKVKLKGKEKILPLGILSEMYPCPVLKEENDDKD